MWLNLIVVLGLLSSSLYVTTAKTIGYQCGGGNLKVSTISTVDVPSCEKAHPITVEKNQIQLLQLTTLNTAQVIQCKVVVNRTIKDCSNATFIPYSTANFIYNLNREECMSAHNERQLTIGKTRIENITKETKTYAAVLAGDDSDGMCFGQKYEDNYWKYSNVSVTATVKITLRTHTGRVDMRTNTIMFDDNSSAM